MVQPAPVDYLQPDEETLVQTGRHGLSVLDEILGALVLAALPVTAVLVLTVGFFPKLFAPLAVPVLAVVCLALAIFLLTRYWRVKTSVYILTDERVYKAYGRLRFFGSQTTFDKLTDIHVTQSFFGRLRGFGTVRLETAGTGIHLEGVRDPLGFKQRVEEARSEFIRTLIGEVPRTTSKGEATPAQEQELWQGGISKQSLLGNLISVGIMVIAASIALIMGAFVPPILFAAAIFVVMAATTAAGVVIRFKFTQYHVGSRSVVVTSGWLTRRRVETTYEKVTDVTIYQGVLGRVLDFGSITINTAGSNVAPVVFQGVRSPETVKEIIDAARRSKETR